MNVKNIQTQNKLYYLLFLSLLVLGGCTREIVIDPDPNSGPRYRVTSVNPSRVYNVPVIDVRQTVDGCVIRNGLDQPIYLHGNVVIEPIK